MTGILLRKNTKAFFALNPPLEGELVYAEDTDEIGSLSGTEVIWQAWDAGFPDQFAYIGDTIPNDSFGEDGRRFIVANDPDITEYVKSNGKWRELKQGATGTWLTANIEPNFHTAELFPYLGKYTLAMADGFVTSSSNDVATKTYIDSIPGVTGKIKLDGSNEFDAGYVPTLDDDVVTLAHLISGDGKLMIPTTKPTQGGVLWNDNGMVRLTRVFHAFDLQVTSTVAPTFTSEGGSITSINNGDGSFTLYSDDNITQFEFTEKSGTKVHVYQGATLINLQSAFNQMFDLEEFNWDGPCNVTNFRYTWNDCSSLLAFPNMDLSHGTDFYITWQRCSGLLEFPLLDFSGTSQLYNTWSDCSSLSAFPNIETGHIVKFTGAWQRCSGLLEFPLLDTSSGTEFNFTWQSLSSLVAFPSLDCNNATTFFYAWYNCTGLSHCPGGNEITIPQGADTADMCLNVPSGGDQ